MYNTKGVNHGKQRQLIYTSAWYYHMAGYYNYFFQGSVLEIALDIKM